MKNKAGVILFGALAVAIAGVTIWNIYLNQNISQATASKQLQVTNDTLKQENNELKKQLNEVLPSAQEQQKRAYLDTVKQFIDVSYLREKEGFEERKKIAKTIMDKELYTQFYPTETFDYGNTYSSNPSDLHLYVQQFDGGQDEVKVIAEFTNHLVIKEENVDDQTHDIIQVLLRKEEKKWVVYSVEELKTEILK
ncbi:MerR family transcriptional regulator [Priestia megaterium]|uniref:MerR family transcriptional regulator n=1 Tax=Priestia megaterium TaxID=1404 RepID=UPI0006824C75|nr:MerR family transcriptional regulator [Priestia megaterium]KNH11088.1 MerR family transcriptional regulator [Priestia megaterium]PAK43507.1 MerR family transcriptional regulator [Priestia megaterium]